MLVDDKKCDNIKLDKLGVGLFTTNTTTTTNNSSKLNANRHKSLTAGSYINDNKTKTTTNDYDDRKFNFNKNLINNYNNNNKLYSLHDLYKNENETHTTNDSDNSQISVNVLNKMDLKVINTNNDNSSNNNNLNESETTTITISISSCSNTDIDDDEEDDDENTNDNEEFQAIYKRISINKLINDDETNLNDKHNLANSKINKNSITTLKNLFKLLKLYKLEHYMNDLVDSNYCSTQSLHELKQKDLDKLNVSPYDKKKFLKLQLFIKQVMHTINVNQTTSSSKSSQHTTRRSSSCSLASKNALPPHADTALVENKIKKLITIKKSNQKNSKIDLSEQAKSASSSNLVAQNGRYLPRNFSGTTLAETQLNQPPSWTPKDTTTPKPSTQTSTAPVVQSKLFIKNPNLPNQQNKMKRVAKASSINNNNNKNNRFSLVQRAKSSEPAIKKTSNSITPSIASKSTTLIDNQPGAAVNHPTQMSRNSKSEYFGPKLQQPLQTEIQNVHFIKTNAYNYGVPQTRSNTATITTKRSKSSQPSIKRSKSNHHLNTNQESNVPSLVTNDIYVYARKRPKLPCEAKFNDIIQVDEDSDKKLIKNKIIVNETKTAVDGTPLLRKNEFLFDKAFDASQTNEEIFKSSIQPFIDQENKLDFTCICFGQTGSGKTHTLFGNKSQEGLCVLTAQNLFQTNERLICGFYEIYNGQLYDLLNQKNRLVLREDSNGQVNVVGLVEIEIKNLNHLKKTIEQAQANRHIGCTSFNKASSRSHAVIQFKVPNVVANSTQSGQVILSRQHFSNRKQKTTQTRPFRVLFIDLAGSERGIDAQTNQNDNRKEGAEINQSLLALKECIRCIDQSCSHAPFRQSKLTRVLRDCFIGYGRTVLVATVSPTDDCVSCSLNTLQYANRVRQMTLRNRMRNEKILKQQTASIKLDQNENAKITKSSTNDLPPKSKKVYKDIFNEDEGNKPYVSSSPISNINEKLNAKNQDVPCHPNVNNLLQKSSTKSKLNKQANVPSMFHPSKINMSSTPTKSVDKLNSKNADDLLFENDTPIKGHKLKYIGQSQPVAQLAERYFARVSLPEPVKPSESSSSDLNSKVFSKTKNEDVESGVESEELNKSNEIKPKHNSIETRSNRLSFISDLNAKYNNSLNVDESLCRLRQKQKDLIESRKFLMHQSNDTINTTKLNTNDTIEPSLFNQKDSSKLTSNNDANHNLRNYIQNLENKLQSLRNEMNENTNNTNRDKLVKKERDLSTDSCDSLKEIKQKILDEDYHSRQKNFSIQLQEFVQQRTQLENHQKKLNNLNNNNDVEEKRKSFNFSHRKFGEEHEELFFKLQTQQSQDSQTQTNFFENSIGSTSSDDNNNPNLSLKKSMHKGLSSTAYLLSKMNKKSFTTSSPVKSDQQIFSPIIKVDHSNPNLETKISSKSFDNDLTPRSAIVNPIPIRLSASSSIESTLINDDNHNSSRLSVNKSDGVLTPSKLKLSNSKIWKSASISSSSQATSDTISTNKKTWSSIIDRAKDVNISKHPTAESLLSHLSAFDYHNKLPLNEINKFRTKDLLVVAHENQLSDITETCKKEMNLLTCLRDSQMGFDEYLNKVEEMLTQKASSIRDLQYQITQLKHIKHTDDHHHQTEQII